MKVSDGDAQDPKNAKGIANTQSLHIMKNKGAHSMHYSWTCSRA
jgi:hypothetical protein